MTIAVPRAAALAGVVALSCAQDEGSATATTGDEGSTSTTTVGSTSPATTGAGTSTSNATDPGTGPGTGDEIDPPPACGSLDYDWPALLPGPGQPDYDEALENKALLHERLHQAILSVPHGGAGDVRVDVGQTEARQAIEDFLAGSGWDFEAQTGLAVVDTITQWQKVTGAFAGMAAAADAYAYGTMRDQGYPCEDVARARDRLVRTIDALHLATEITGVPGVIARAFGRKDLPGVGASPTTPLFDGMGNPLPVQKDNGTWREDNSGSYPDYVWEDSCSRDQLVGWAAGMGAVWEVIAFDPEFDDAVKDRLQADAAAIGRSLMEVRDSGYDLEILDADGRTTYHGYLHEHALDRDYVAFFNGHNALMAAGIVAALAYVSEDEEIAAYLYDELLGERALLRIASEAMVIDFGVGTNYSNYNMAFSAAWLADRYLEGAAMREDLRATAEVLYSPEGSVRPVDEVGQSFFDFVYAAIVADASAFGETTGVLDADAVERGRATLHAFPTPPNWDLPVENCDAAEIAAQTCQLDDGTPVGLIVSGAWNDTLVADEIVPIEIRAPSNYVWRSNPFDVNGGSDGSNLPSSSDFRIAYWIGRWTRR